MLLVLALIPDAACGESDAALVAAALTRREAALEAEGCPPRGWEPGLRRAAAGLAAGVDQGPVPHARAVFDVFVAASEADARSAECALAASAPPDGRPRSPPRSHQATPDDLYDVAGRLTAWGEPEAAAAWRRIAEVAATPRTPAPDPTLCRCMAQAQPGLRVVYGYPGPTLSARSLLGEVVLGGCVVPESPEALACSPGCWPDVLRDGERPPVSTRHTGFSSGAGLIVGVAGTARAAARWEATGGGRTAAASEAAFTTLAECLAGAPAAQAIRTAEGWAPHSTGVGGSCLAAWMNEQLPDGGADHAVLVRQK